MNKVPRQQSGMVFILALLTMSFIVITGVAYLQIAESYSDGPVTKLNRARVQAIAEGGHAVALQVLDGDPDFVGTIGPNSLGMGSYTVTVTSSGSAVSVDTRATLGGISGGVGSRFERQVPPPGLWGSAVLAQGDIALNNNSHLIIPSGDLRAGGTLSVNATNSTLTGTSEQLVSGFTALAIDMAKLAATADTILAPSTTISSGNYTGTIYCAGALTIDGPASFAGTLLVAGNLQVKPFGADVSFINPDGGLAVVVTGGQMTCNNLGTLEIDGHIVTTNGFNLNRVSNLDATGGVITNGNMVFTQVVGEWSVDDGDDGDEDILDDPRIGFITGGPPPSSSAWGPPEEVWRRLLLQGE